MNFFSGVRRTALQSQSCPKNNMGASLGFFGRVRPTFPLARARGWSAGVRRRRRPTRRVSPSRCDSAVGAGRAAGRASRSAGQSSPPDSEWGLQTRPTRNANGPGPGWSNPATDSELAAAARPEKGPGSRARPTRSASGVPVAFTESQSRGRPTRSEAVEPCRLGVESRSSRARPGPTRSGVVDSR